MSRLLASNFDAELARRRRNGLWRRQHILQTPQGAHIRVDGRDYVNFSSNDYLGLAGDPALVEAMATAVRRYGVGSGASPLVCGRSSPIAELEARIAALTGRRRALVFGSGYQANLAAVTALMQGRHGLVALDRLAHASLIDAARLSGARYRRYRHCDPGALERLLSSKDTPVKLVLTDSIFSMDGDRAPLKALAGVAARCDSLLLVDDAHGFGVFAAGSSLTAAGITESEVPVLVGTFGKAVGTAGAFVAGPDPYLEMLIQHARPYIYSTAPPPALAATTLVALQRIVEDGWRRLQLRTRIQQFRHEAAASGLNLCATDGPIQPLMIGAADAAAGIAENMRRRGFWLVAMRPPTVPPGRSRLRIVITAKHSAGDVSALVAALAAELTGASPAGP